ncbi:uncharacterized RNA methyltransferase pc1998 [Dioscorea cayenensis subsp. rotundata]|uniref:Uncharacterized RNA methyltransferase pc1998 n=1 Tax=Dioscorea cayennensis subsp. rotundata TaxID=55577 RepID=A0AB40B137_DIOCR|nr:uncharacterized RNA methyltransferase pc1998 [Dioscorea cayenensis subsp. rotundata]
MALSLRLPSLITAGVASRRRPPPPLSRTNPNQKSLLQGTSSSGNAALQCEHFQSCSGCSHEFALDRPSVLQEVNSFFEEHGVQDFSFENGRLWGWRCRAKLAVRGSPDSPLIGLYQEGSHNVVDIPLCKAHHPNINAAVNLLKQGITTLNIQPYDEDSGFGELRYAQMAVTTRNTSLPLAERYLKGKVQVSLVWNSRNEQSQNAEKLNSLMEFLWKNGGPNSNAHLIHSIWVNFQTSSTNIIFGNRWRHFLGERDFWEHVGGVDISLDPSSFGQANTQAFDSLLRKLQKYVPYGSSVTDLYAGAGIIGLSIASIRKCRSVKCVEINKESKQSFEKSLSRLLKSVDGSISWHNTDASIEPLHWLEGSDVVVVDPPRKGLDPSLVAALKAAACFSGKTSKSAQSSVLKVKEEKRPWILRARKAAVQMDSKTACDRSETWPQTLIYISCGWESFKEDCKSLLADKSWHLEKAHAFNFFPGTDSIEVLAVFKCGPRVAQKKKKGKKKTS